ncbi:MAG TPA: pentapeptide repeat-containing protein [Lutibacter sp.]
MKELTPLELENYFKSDKSTWYSVLPDGSKMWNEKKVNQFWKNIRENKIKHEDYNFSGFCFPKFQNVDYSTKRNERLKMSENFWEQGSKRIFNSNINFSSSKFQGEALFCNIHFEQKVNFCYANSFDKFYFNSSIVEDEINFESASFYYDCDFSFSIFNEDVHIISVLFEGQLTCKYVSFNEGGMFSFGTYNKEVIFENSIFDGITYFSDNTFLDILVFENINAKKTDIIRTGTSEPPILKFENLRFTKKIQFSRINLSKVNFVNCDLTECSFSRCSWNVESGRIIFAEETKCQVFLSECETIEKDDIIIRLKDSEEHYRQIKNKFDNTKDWELSGLAYVSEMEMRKKRLLKERKYLQWSIYSFYGYFGGYTQNFIKPLKWYLFLTFLFFPLYYLIEHYFKFRMQILKMLPFNFEDALQHSLASSIPFIKSNVQYSNWWAMMAQTIFSGILLTFFVLALRKRFKQ